MSEYFIDLGHVIKIKNEIILTKYIGNCDSNWQLSSKDKIPVDIYKVHKAIYFNREMAVLVLTIFQVLDELKIYSLNIYFKIYLLNLLVPTHMLLYV